MYRQKLIDTAIAEIGRAEPHGDDKYIKWYNDTMRTSFSMQAPWCAMFVSWCGTQAGYGDIIPPYASCTAMSNWYKARGEYFTRRQRPEPIPGDLVYYDWDPAGSNGPDHVGIIETVNGNTLSVIEGNYSDRVRRRTITTDDVRIMGYAVPAYPTGDANDDGAVTAADALEVLKKVVGKPSTATRRNADVNRDDQVTAADALEITKKVVRQNAKSAKN